MNKRETNPYLEATVKAVSAVDPTGVIEIAAGVLGGVDQALNTYHGNKMKRNVEEFIRELESDPVLDWSKRYDRVPLDNFDEFTNCLNLILIESESSKKSKYTARLLYSLMKAEIDFDEFRDFVLIVHSSSVPALESLAQITILGKYEGLEETSYVVDGPNVGLAVSTGLAMDVTHRVETESWSGDSDLDFTDLTKLTRLGETFFKICHAPDRDYEPEKSRDETITTRP